MKTPTRPRRAALWIAAALGIVALPGCGDTTFVARFDAGGLRAIVCSGNDEFCADRLTPPSADAGAARSVPAGTAVTLDGSASSDADGRIISFEWAQIGGPPVVLSDADSARASFEAPAVGETTLLAFELTVTDDDRQSASDRVEITVEPRSVVASSRGLSWLQGVVSPASHSLPPDSADADSTTPVTIGMWLVATTTGRHLKRDPTHIETHLANLRGLLTNLEQRPPQEIMHPLGLGAARVAAHACEGERGLAGGALLAAGLTQTGALVAPLDASLAERFRALAGSLGIAPRWETLDRLLAGTVTLRRRCDLAVADGIGADEAIERATSLLLGLDGGVEADTVAVAAATLTVLGASERDPAQSSSSPTSTQIPLSQRSTDSPLLTSAPSP